MKTIMLPHGEKQKLAADFGVSRQLLHLALVGKKDTPLAQRLRKAAIERGGAEYDPERQKRTN